MENVGWDSFEKIFMRMEHNVLIDFVMSLECDRSCEVPCIEDLRRTSGEEIVRKLRSRHFYYRAVAQDFDDWLDRIGKRCFFNKNCPHPLGSCVLESCCSAEKVLPPPSSRVRVIGNRELYTSEAIKIAEDNPGLRCVFRNCKMYSDTPSLGRPDNLFFDRCRFVGLAGTFVRKPGDFSSTFIKDRTTPAYMDVIKHQMVQMSDDAVDKTIMQMMDRVARETAEQMDDEIIQSIVDGRLKFQDIPESAVDDINRVQASMKANRDKLMNQIYDGYQLGRISGESLISQVFSPADKIDAIEFKEGLKKAMLEDETQSSNLQQSRSHRDILDAGFECLQLAIARQEEAKKKPLLNGDWSSMQATKSRGFPVWYGVPEVKKVDIGPQTVKELPPPGKLTESDIRMDMFEEDWRQAKKSVLETKKEIVQRMLKEIEEEEKERPKVGSPFSLIDWCQEPLTTALHKEKKW